MTREDLIKFEDFIGKLYEEGKIKSPIHLAGCKYGKQEKFLLNLYKKIDKKKDWIFCTWRSHYHWLLFDKNPQELLQQILDGHSMHIFGERFFTSAIVGGIAPIAVGVALAKKMKGEGGHIWCFLGDMAYTSGIALESVRYASGFNLPITFIVEDNGLSVETSTKEVWGKKREKNVIIYTYKRKFPHAGIGKYVMF